MIHGGRPLHGEIEISGAKNAAVAIIPAALMVDGVCRIENMPQISDVDMLLKILQGLGARVEYLSPSAVEIDCTQVRFTEPPYDLMRKIRASYYFIGSMLGRFGSAKTTMPGGCNFGVRPIDQHIKGMTAMGANVEVKNGFVYADTPDGRLHGAKVYLDKVSVGATMNIIIAATLARGRTVIENAAREPHIVDLANFLNSMGADIRGAGTDSIRIQGVERLHGGTYSVIPDQIEAGTYMTACAAAGGEVLLTNVIPRHLECISAKLREMGVTGALKTLADAVGMEHDGASLGCACSDEISGALTCNMGILHVKDGKVTASLDLRCPVAADLSALTNAIRAHLPGFSVDSLEIKEPHHVPADSKLVRSLLDSYTEVTGEPAAPHATGGGTYAKVLKQGVAYGAAFPEDEDLAHQANEYIRVSQMVKAMKIYAAALMKLAAE